MTPIPSGLARLAASPVARCGAAVLASLAAIAGLGGPERLGAAHPEVYLVLLLTPVGMCFFYAAQGLLASVAAARREGGDAPR